jgi:hypothetical protein
MWVSEASTERDGCHRESGSKAYPKQRVRQHNFDLLRFTQLPLGELGSSGIDAQHDLSNDVSTFDPAVRLGDVFEWKHLGSQRNGP